MKAITNGKVVTVTGATYEKGTVIVDGSTIVAVGENVEIPAACEVIDANGGWITPGLIDCHSHISLMEAYGSMPGMQDYNEFSDPITPQISAKDALNPFDEGIAEVMKAGFTTCFTGPGSGNVIGGCGISFKLTGTTAEEMIIEGSQIMKCALGENPKRLYGLKDKAPVTRMATAAMFRNTMKQAVEYSDELKDFENGKIDKKPKFDPKLDALVQVVRGEMRCKIHCHRADDITTAIRLAKEFNLDFTLEHATEGYKVTDIINEAGVTCIIGPLLLQHLKREVWGLRLDTPAKLYEAGVHICLTADEGEGTKNLPTHVGIIIKNGLPEKAAFEAVTINAAKALKLENRIGSLEKGKDADIAVFDGHPFSNMTNCVMTMINGEVCHSKL